MWRIVFVLTFIATTLGGAVVIDRIGVIVGNHVIKSSDIERDLRLTDFLNHEPLSLSSDARRKAAERLIDQQIIRNEIWTGGYARATDAEADALRKQIERDRFAGSATRARAELARYGLDEDQLKAQLLWQLTVLRFIEQKFQPAVSVSDEDLRAYYKEHFAELRRRHPKDSSFSAVQDEIRASVEGDKVNQGFETWLAQARQRNRIEYREGAFQ
jgi:hypothetical protein